MAGPSQWRMPGWIFFNFPSWFDPNGQASGGGQLEVGGWRLTQKAVGYGVMICREPWHCLVQPLGAKPVPGFDVGRQVLSKTTGCCVHSPTSSIKSSGTWTQNTGHDLWSILMYKTYGCLISVLTLKLLWYSIVIIISCHYLLTECRPFFPWCSIVHFPL